MNVIDQVTLLQPTDETIDGLWSADDRRALMQWVLDDRERPAAFRPRSTPGRRRATLVAIGAAAAVAAVAIPVLLPGGHPGGPTSAAAAELHRLAAKPGSSALRSGEFAYTVQLAGDGALYGSTRSAINGRIDERNEIWMASTGASWEVATTGTGKHRRVQTAYWPANHKGPFAPSSIAKLPTEPHALLSYLRAHASGSNSVDQAVFVQVGDILGNVGPLTSPALRSAMLKVLATLDHVTVGPAKVDARNRAVVEFDYAGTSEIDSLYFDPNTAELRGEGSRQPGQPVDTSDDLMVGTTIVHAVPTGVRERAQR